jgi:protein tyrosine phosphatase (PTP) superfamily phosphohydrolase (DUF442 family)
VANEQRPGLAWWGERAIVLCVALSDIRNFRSIDDRLGTAGQPTEAQLDDVAAAGYAVVVNLGLLDPKYCLPDEAGAVAALGMAYRHIPVKFDAPRVEDFRTFVAAMDAWSDRKVFVHCAANFRASAFVAVYGELRLGWTPARAEELVRLMWQPNATWRAFIDKCRAEVVDP